ncbi:hypothetical protein HYX09_02615 [Candidatus Woesearchaeota archaeon]|nr:hypothetical protein [Candidatus Woesearchaeota archaeon]
MQLDTSEMRVMRQPYFIGRARYIRDTRVTETDPTAVVLAYGLEKLTRLWRRNGDALVERRGIELLIDLNGNVVASSEKGKSLALLPYVTAYVDLGQQLKAFEEACQGKLIVQQKDGPYNPNTKFYVQSGDSLLFTAALGDSGNGRVRLSDAGILSKRFQGGISREIVRLFSAIPRVEEELVPMYLSA